MMEDLPYLDDQYLPSDRPGTRRPAAIAASISFTRRRDRTPQGVSAARKRGVAAVSHTHTADRRKQLDARPCVRHVLLGGVDPKTSVLDPQNRAHDVDDLFVVDASFFPSSAGLNPSLTVAANALRVAEHVNQAHFTT